MPRILVRGFNKLWYRRARWNMKLILRYFGLRSAKLNSAPLKYTAMFLTHSGRTFMEYNMFFKKLRKTFRLTNFQQVHRVERPRRAPRRLNDYDVTWLLVGTNEDKTVACEIDYDRTIVYVYDPDTLKVKTIKDPVGHLIG